MATLVTGGNGFIGSRLVDALRSQGEEVRVLDLPRVGAQRKDERGITCVAGDIRSKSDVMRAMSGCDRVFHLAACARNWTKRNDEYYDINVGGTSTVLQAALHHGVSRVVMTSTNLTYGPSNGKPVTEEAIRMTDYFNTYERSKNAAEHVAHRYVRRGLSIVIVHPTRVFGPGPISEANSVTKIILLYAKGRFRTLPGDGSSIGNYVYVDDLVRGFINAMECGRPGEHYILGGENVSFDEFFETLSSLLGRSRLLVRLPASVAMKFAEVQRWLARTFGVYPLVTPGWMKVFLDDWVTSCEKATREIGYTITPFPTALSNTLSWLRQQDLLPS